MEGSEEEEEEEEVNEDKAPTDLFHWTDDQDNKHQVVLKESTVFDNKSDGYNIRSKGHYLDFFQA